MSLDRLINGKWEEEVVRELNLLEAYKVIQDRVWERIWLTELEIYLIDTEPFQRLHWKLQLGTTLFVFPSATHTRFEHSLGTVQGVNMIIEACKKNKNRYPGARDITPYEHFLARLAALLHDLAQMPFGHTLKNEGHVLDVEWDCEKIRQILISPEGLVPNRIKDFLREKWQKLSTVIRRKITVEKFVESVRQDLEWVLTKGISNKTKEKPPKECLAFISDIVGNTLSGDLLDYVQRDYVSLGISEEKISPIPLEFVIVKNVPHNKTYLPRLVLTLWKPSKPGKMRKDVVRYIINLFDKRCTLAENVYFHHAKNSASAMLIKAVHLSGMSCEEIWKYGDLTLLDKLAKWEPKDNEPEEVKRSKIIRSLAQKILTRHLFKNIYECFHAELEARHLKERVLQYCKGKNASKRQREFEEALISYFPNISDDQIAVYCPDPDMNLKPFETLVWPTENESIKKLRKISDAYSIEQRHKELWRFTVFVDPDVLSTELVSQLRTTCNKLLLEEQPEYELARIWVNNYMPQIEEALESQGLKLSARVLQDARKVVREQLQQQTRRRRATISNLKAPPLKAPPLNEVLELVIQEESPQ